MRRCETQIDIRQDLTLSLLKHVAQGIQHQYQAKNAGEVACNLVQQVAQGTQQQSQSKSAQPAAWHTAQMLRCLFAHSFHDQIVGPESRRPAISSKFAVWQDASHTAAQQHCSPSQQTNLPGFEVQCLGVNHRLVATHNSMTERLRQKEIQVRQV